MRLKSILLSLGLIAATASAASAEQILLRNVNGQIAGRGQISCRVDPDGYYGLDLIIYLNPARQYAATRIRAGGVSSNGRGTVYENELDPYSGVYNSKSPTTIIAYSASRVVRQSKVGAVHVTGSYVDLREGRYSITDSLNRSRIRAICPTKAK
jgi:hypothetical protein